MTNQIQALRRRIEHYIRNKDPRKIIRVADFLRSIADESDDDINLLNVSDQLRNHYEQPQDKKVYRRTPR